MGRIPRRGSFSGGCGTKSTKGLAHACGFGTTGAAAWDAALSEAKVIAYAAAQSWIDQQRCSVKCPIKLTSVHIPPRGTPTKKSQKVLSENTYKLATGEPGSDGRIPPVPIFGLCVVIAWEAVVQCSPGIGR
jgi:hypothetical protein